MNVPAPLALTWPPLPPEAATWPVCPRCEELVGWCDTWCGVALPPVEPPARIFRVARGLNSPTEPGAFSSAMPTTRAA